MQIKTQGLIIREQTVGESDRLVTVLTRDEGVVRAFARKAKTMKDSKRAGTQLLCYSRLNLFKGRDKYIINDAFPIEVFFPLRNDIVKLSLAQYFCELVAVLAPEGLEAAERLRALLNALHFLCRGARSNEQIKVIAELRLLSLSGYMPNLVCCRSCGVYEAEQGYFAVNAGDYVCAACYERTGEEVFALSSAALKGMRHIIYADMERLFSFQLTGLSLKQAALASEAFMYSVVQKKMAALDFYHAMRRPSEFT